MIDLKRFDALAVDGRNLVIYDQHCFNRDTALSASKWRWAVLSKWYVGILVDTLFADAPFVRCEQ